MISFDSMDLRAFFLLLSLSLTVPAQTVVEKDAVVLGFKLHYREAGRGLTVILLHGLGGDGSRWGPNIVPLAREFRVIALDQIGFGESDKPLANYHPGMLAEFLVRFIAKIGAAKASLVGSSMGADAALYAAVHFPEVVDRLVLADGGGFHRSAAMMPSEQPDSHLRQIQNGVTSQETREFLRILFHNKSLVTARFVEDNLALRLRSSYAISKIQEATEKGLGSPSEEEVRAVKIRTLIVWGRYDELANPVSADRLAAVIPGSRKVIIDDAGHLPQLEKSEQFNRVVAEFLREDTNGATRSQ
jgi:pimeloyl-ACP methyl ester carboxylesterase